MKKKLIINGNNFFVLSETLSKVLHETNISRSKNLAVAVNEEVIQKINKGSNLSKTTELTLKINKGSNLSKRTEVGTKINKGSNLSKRNEVNLKINKGSNLSKRT